MAYKAITPSPVQYNDIFRKKPTPDERLYILKQIQQGLDKVQKGILGRIPGAPTVAVPSATAPSATQPSDEIGQTIGAPPSGGSGGEGIPIDDLPPLSASTAASSDGAAIAEYDETVPQVSGELSDPRQTDGVDEVNAALASDERAAVPLVTPAALDPVTEDVVSGGRDMIADMPGGFPTEEEKVEEQPKDDEDTPQERGEVRSKPPSWFMATRAQTIRTKLWRQQYDKEHKPQMSSTSTPLKMSPMTGRRPSK
jgi:hypothetical protein